MTTFIHYSDPALSPSMGSSSNNPASCQYISLGFGPDTNSELSDVPPNTIKRNPTLRDSLDLIYREYGDLMQRLSD